MITDAPVSTDRLTYREVERLNTYDVVPTVSDLYPGTQALAVHSIADFLDTSDPALNEQVAAYYATRAITHHWGVRSGDTLLVHAVEPENAHAVRSYASLYAEVTGINLHPVVEPEDVGLARDQITYTPYFPAQHYQKGNLYGLDPTQALELRDKARFADIVRGLNGRLARIAEQEGVYGNLVLPHIKVESADDLPRAAEERLAEVDAMYKTVELKTANLSYPRGVVIQDLGGDGGYGTIHLTQTTDGTWSLKGTRNFDGEYASLQDAITSLSEATRSSKSQYKITRLVDTKVSPSVHVYVHGQRVFALPVTYQLMDSDSCVGGGSENAVPDGISIEPHERRVMQRTAEYIMAQTTTDSSAAGMACFDFIIAGEQENILREAVLADPEMTAQFGGEVIQKGYVECNPRHTSISGAAWPAISAMVHARIERYQAQHPGEIVPAEVTAVTYEDIQTMYGHTNTAGETGGFFTFDKIYLPDGIENETQLAHYIALFNATAASYGVFMLPRIRVHRTENGTYQTSVILGMLPHNVDETPERLAAFQGIVAQLQESRNLASILL